MTSKAKTTTIIISLLVLVVVSVLVTLKLTQISQKPISFEPKAEGEEVVDIFANVTPASVCQKNLSVQAPTLTPTATPTITLTPTAVPTATNTPRPTSTSAPVPTEQLTSTPRPTSTVQPTNTPRPTSTPRPTTVAVEPEPTEIELPKAGLKIPTIGGIFGGFFLLAVGLALVF